MAIENLSGLSLNESVVKEFSEHPEYIEQVGKILEDDPVSFNLVIETY